jgi:hypothetical protein
MGFKNIPKACLKGLAQAFRVEATKPNFAQLRGNETARTLAKTEDLRADFHPKPKNPQEGVIIIQANRETKNPSLKKFLKGATRGHKGTHQTIGDKIHFALGKKMNAESVATAIENAGIGAGFIMKAPERGKDAKEWTWDEEKNKMFRIKNDGKPEYRDPPAAEVPETREEERWEYSKEFRKHYCRGVDGRYKWD